MVGGKMNSIRQAIIDRIWQGKDPLHGFPGNLIEFDLQGWNSQHPYLTASLSEVRPQVVVEIGVWKGGSSIFMAKHLKESGLPAVVISVDTWLGSSEHWTNPEFFDDLCFVNGYPALYYKFISNVIRTDVADHIVPLPLDSLNAAIVMRRVGVTPGVIHLDGGHDYDSVIADLRAWWPVLAPGGIFVGDDYYDDGRWPTVRQAFDEFFAQLDLKIEYDSGKCRIRKPA
jgi:SAM-dependent methyltransferase